MNYNPKQSKEINCVYLCGVTMLKLICIYVGATKKNSIQHGEGSVNHSFNNFCFVLILFSVRKKKMEYENNGILFIFGVNSGEALSHTYMYNIYLTCLLLISSMYSLLV